jgi:predicted nucleic acid-binding protein
VSFVALLDANVLYPPYLRDLLLRFAQAGVFEPRWSAEILDEVARNIKKGRGEAEQQKVERMLSLMRRHFEDAEVTGYEALTPAMTNDEKDRHVLAAAIVGGSDVIVTSNLKHFPRAALEPYDMDVQGPDEFLCHQWSRPTPSASSTSSGAGRTSYADTPPPWRRSWRSGCLLPCRTSAAPCFNIPGAFPARGELRAEGSGGYEGRLKRTRSFSWRFTLRRGVLRV